MPFLEIAIFILSCLGIIVSSRWVIGSLSKLARSLGWKEYVVAFFTVSLGAVLPEFTIGMRAAFGGVPELSLGNIIGQNIILLTFAVAVCTLVVKGIVVQSRTVRAGATFAAFAVTLPFILLSNGTLSRLDGLILIASFGFYVFWLFGKDDRFVKDYETNGEEIKTKTGYLKNFFIFLGSFLLVVFSAEGIVYSATEFALILDVPEGLIGILLVGAGVALPEIYFSLKLATKGRSWMILGGLTGAVAMSSTLVLGAVALVNPITLSHPPHLAESPYSISMMFLVLGGVSLWFFVRTNNKLTRKEAIYLFIIYFTFLISELYFGELFL